MSLSPPLLIFSDLDGTLMSHADYRWQAASPALETLRDIGAGIVLASSKTAVEMIAIRSELGLERWPAIVENGAGVLAAYSRDVPANSAYRSLRAALDGIPTRLRRKFCGFADMTAMEIARITGLSPASAERAAERAFSEPGLWSGDSAERDEFLTCLRGCGIAGRDGGRFLTLSFGQTKADQMGSIIDTYRPRHTIALGDAPNDVEMLETADFGVIVANPHRDPMPVLAGESTGRIIRTVRTGPEGWNAAVLDLIARLDLKRKTTND